MKIEKKEELLKSKELLPQIVERIFFICRNDPNFRLKNELESVDEQLENLQKKISKQDALLKQSQVLKKDLHDRINIIENQNRIKQSALLEGLGSEL